jgi:type VI protein secretion system component VasA
MGSDNAEAFYTLRRVPRMQSAKQKRLGTRTNYVGTEVFMSLVDPAAAPYAEALTQISVNTLCTNRDLPLVMPTGGQSDFVLEASAPVRAVRCLGVPSRPVEPVLDGSLVWRCISHLSLNYLSLTDLNEQDGAVALREMLHLYARDNESVVRRHLEGVRSVPSRRHAPDGGARPVTVRTRHGDTPLVRERASSSRSCSARCWRSSSPGTRRSTHSLKRCSMCSVAER